MSLSSWAATHQRLISFCLAGAAPVIVGTYINIYTGLALEHFDTNVVKIVPECGWWNLLVPFFLVTLWLQFYVSRLPELQFEQIQGRLITRVLEAACRSLVYPKSLDEAHIRAIVSLVDEGKENRLTRFSFNTNPDPERLGKWPVSFGVTGEAMSGRQVVLRELPPGHHTTYSDEVKREVLKDIKTILAAPLLDPRAPRDLPLGVVAFDSIMSIKELGFTGREIRFVAQAWADVLSIILTQRDFPEGIQ